MTTLTNRAPTARSPWRRRVLAAAGGILGVFSLGLIAAGGLAGTAAIDGYVKLGHANVRTDDYAIISDPYDWSTATFLLGSVSQVRIRVTPSESTVPAFVGLAEPEALEQYLTGVAYTTAHEAPNYSVTYTQHNGAALSTPPAQADLWTARASGTGTLTLEFPADTQSGNRSLVGMNADGSPSVGGQVETAVTVPSLPWIAAALLIGGVVLLAGSVVLIVRALRSGTGRCHPLEA